MVRARGSSAALLLVLAAAVGSHCSALEQSVSGAEEPQPDYLQNHRAYVEPLVVLDDSNAQVSDPLSRSQLVHEALSSFKHSDHLKGATAPGQSSPDALAVETELEQHMFCRPTICTGAADAHAVVLSYADAGEFILWGQPKRAAHNRKYLFQRHPDGRRHVAAAQAELARLGALLTHGALPPPTTSHVAHMAHVHIGSRPGTTASPAANSSATWSARNVRLGEAALARLRTAALAPHAVIHSPIFESIQLIPNVEARVAAWPDGAYVPVDMAIDNVRWGSPAFVSCTHRWSSAAVVRSAGTCPQTTKIGGGSNIVYPYHLDLLDGDLNEEFHTQNCICGDGVHIYVIDTGTQGGHSEFEDRIGEGVNLLSSDGPDDQWSDTTGHGTHVMALAGGRLAGVAKCATLHPVRVIDDGPGSLLKVVQGLDWAVDHAVNNGWPAVITMSIGIGSEPSAINFMTTTIEAAASAGYLTVVAAGNGGVDACTVGPSNVPVALAVGAVDKNRVFCNADNTMEGDSECGFNSNYGTCVGVLAPGALVYSARGWVGSNNSYEYQSGE
eukprot:scaffold1619_cov242-Prasinococcus_capsulatus_cf.AAC.1